MDAETLPQSDTAPAVAYSHAQILRVLSGVLLCILLAALDQTVVVPAVPAIAADLRGFGHLAWIVTAYLLTSTAAMPVYGRLSDIYGRRAMLLPALALFMLASTFCALSPNLDALIAARALQGIGGAGLVAMAQVAIADVVAPRERGRYQAYMSGAWGIASIAGPIVGGYMTDHLSWRWVFWINLPIGAIAMLLCERGLRILHTRQQRSRIDFAGAGLLTGGITAWLLVLSGSDSVSALLAPDSLALAATGAILFALLVAQERRAPDPLLPPRLFRIGEFVRGVAIAFLAALGLFAATFLLPLYYQLVRGADAGSSGALVVPFLAANVVASYLAGASARRIGRTRVILATGLAACAVGFGLLGLTSAGAPEIATVLCSAVVGAGVGAVMPVVTVVVQNAIERRDIGSGTGALLFLRSMGGAFGSTLAGVLLIGRFDAGIQALHPPLHIDLGALRGGGAALAGLTAAAHAAAVAALSSGFRIAFWTCAALSAVGVAVAATMRDVPLQSVRQD
jgi:EmrB/QacA subfamily drug resistance transporter